MTPVTDKQALEHMRKHSVNAGVIVTDILIEGDHFVPEMGYDDAWIYIHHCQLHTTPSIFRGTYWECVEWYALTCTDDSAVPIVMAGNVLWLDTTF